MALLTKEGLQKVIELLVSEGLVDSSDVARVQAEVAQTKRPLVETLTAQGIVTDDMLAHATAVVMGVPYVNLKNVEMDQATLSLLPLEVAERSMGGGIALFALNFIIGGVIGGFILAWRLIVAVWYVPLTVYRLIVG